MSDRDRQRRRTGVSQIAQAYRNAHEVVSAAMGLALLAAGGWWLDQRFGMEPWGVIAGAMIGCLTAGMSLRQLLRRLDREAQKRRESGIDGRDSDGRQARPKR